MGRVLVIDDEPVVCDVVTIALRIGGRFTTDVGTTGADLIALLESRGDVVAVICDYHLRGENGLAIRDRIDATLRDRRIAFLLLHGTGSELRESLPPGYLEQRQIIEVQKPMASIMDLVGIVEAEVERLRAH